MLIISTRTSSWTTREIKEAAMPPTIAAKAGTPLSSETVPSCLVEYNNKVEHTKTELN